MNEQLVELSRTLKSRGFQVHICNDRVKAVDCVSRLISEYGICESIGFGNSITLISIGLQERLLKYTHNIFIHTPIGTEEADRKALTADFYFTSANAISMDGHIVNIDGTGNRTAATCFGPKHVIYLIGRNKVTNTLEDALFRVRNVVAVELARRYNRKTPCNITGKCEDCISPECICAVTTIHRKKPYGVDITVILIDEDLGI